MVLNLSTLTFNISVWSLTSYTFILDSQFGFKPLYIYIKLSVWFKTSLHSYFTLGLVLNLALHSYLTIGLVLHLSTFIINSRFILNILYLHNYFQFGFKSLIHSYLTLSLVLNLSTFIFNSQFGLILNFHKFVLNSNIFYNFRVRINRIFPNLRFLTNICD